MKYIVTQENHRKFYETLRTSGYELALQAFVDSLPEPQAVGLLVATEEMAAKMVACYMNTWPGAGCTDAAAALDMLNAALADAPWVDYAKELAENDAEIASLKIWREQYALAETQPLQERIAELKDEIRKLKNQNSFMVPAADLLEAKLKLSPHADLENAVVDTAIVHITKPAVDYNTYTKLEKSVEALLAARKPKTRTAKAKRMLHINCPYCGTLNMLSQDVAGTTFECDDCHSMIEVNHD